MAKEYRINRAVYKVERIFIGTKQVSELFREHITKETNMHIPGRPYQTTKTEKVV